MKTISLGIVALVWAAFGSRVLHAQELSYCSMSGDSKIDVMERVKVVKAGRVSVGPKISLHAQPEDVCNANEHCLVQATSPLNSGREGIEMGRNKQWVCVAVPGKKPLDVWLGWLPEQRWQQIDLKQNLKDWTGVWQNESAKLNIRLSEIQQLSATGHALWIGGAMGISHFGDFNITGVPDNGVLATSSSEPEYGCHIAVRLVGAFIFAADNRNCGGMNISFDGVYRFRHGLLK